MDWLELLVSAGIIGLATWVVTWATRDIRPLDYVDRDSTEIRSIERRYSNRKA